MLKIQDSMKAVYTYFLPEVRRLVSETQAHIDSSLFLTHCSAAHAQNMLDKILPSALSVPRTQEGYVDLDSLHIPILERLVSLYQSQVKALPSFPWVYPCAGSSEGLFHALVFEKSRGATSVYVLDGEYEGLAAQARNIGMQVYTVNPRETNIEKLPQGLWYISNPSARDGNIITNEFVNNLCNQGHRLILDLAYVGATKPYQFDVSHPQIAHVVFSLSKPFGLFRFRIGCALSRQEIPSLYGNRWFKDISRFIQGLAIVETLGLDFPWKSYHVLQAEIVRKLRNASGFSLQASDAYLLAHLDKESINSSAHVSEAEIAQFARGNSYRFCLTPFFEAIEAPFCAARSDLLEFKAQSNLALASK